jgi:glutaredoxin
MKIIKIFSKSYCSYCKKAIALAEKYSIDPEIIQLDSIHSSFQNDNLYTMNSSNKPTNKTVPANIYT